MGGHVPQLSLPLIHTSSAGVKARAQEVGWGYVLLHWLDIRNQKDLLGAVKMLNQAPAGAESP